jgi:hypothetical protein
MLPRERELLERWRMLPRERTLLDELRVCVGVRLDR